VNHSKSLLIVYVQANSSYQFSGSYSGDIFDSWGSLFGILQGDQHSHKTNKVFESTTKNSWIPGNFQTMW